MKNPSIATMVAVCIATAGAAQQAPSLLFTQKGIEQSKSGSAGTYLKWQTPHAISVVTPVPGCTQSAEKFAADWNYQTMAGDTDGDGFVSRVAFMGGIDAIASLPYKWNPQTQMTELRTAPVTVYDTYISPVSDVGTTVSGAPGLRKGDCGRFVRTAAGNGQVRYFIRAEQLIAALGMVTQEGQPLTPADINLDAITVSLQRHIFLSFEGDHFVKLFQNGVLMNFFLQDGAVACIRGAMWTPNADGEVSVVQPNRGIIALTEAQVDAMVVNSNVANSAGANPGVITDTNGVATDPNGGNFPVAWGASLFNLNNLLLSGETLTGAGVITTGGGPGVIAIVNGCPLASVAAAPTTGAQMGLLAPVASSVENLESLDHEPCYFVLATPTPGPGVLPGGFQVHVGTNLPVAMVFLGFGVGAWPVSPSLSVLGLAPNTLCYPEYYPTILPNPLIPIALAAAGGGHFGSINIPWAPALAGGILFQALAVAGGSLHLSTPGTIN